MGMTSFLNSSLIRIAVTWSTDVQRMYKRRRCKSLDGPFHERSRLDLIMADTPGADIPSEQNGWLRLLKKILLELLDAAGSVASWLFNVLWPQVARACNTIKDFGTSLVH